MKCRSLFLLTAAFLSIHHPGYNQSKRTLPIADMVHVARDQGQRPVYGTHIFMTPPQGFTFNASTGRFEKNSLTYLKVLETPGAGYTGKRNDFLAVIREENIAGFQTYYQKDFILQNKKAVILYGLDRTKTREMIVMLFGDTAGSAMISSGFAAGDQNSKNIVLKSMLSAFREDVSTVNVSEIQDFTIETLDTKFSYNTTVNTGVQMFIYSLDGKGDPLNDTTADYIAISQTAPMDDQTMKGRVHSMITIFKTKGIEITDAKEEVITIDDRPAYSLTAEGKLKGKRLSIYLFITGNSKSTIMYQGFAFHNQAMYLQQFRKIGRTLRLK